MFQLCGLSKMSCPNCQIAGRRLPSLPLGYISKMKKEVCYKNFQNFNMSNRNIRVQHIGSATLPRIKQTTYLEGKLGLVISFFLYHVKLFSMKDDLFWILNHIVTQCIQEFIAEICFRCTFSIPKNKNNADCIKRELSWVPPFCIICPFNQNISDQETLLIKGIE